MKEEIEKGKVLWRKPFEQKIYFLKDIGGEDQFVIAPFNKSLEAITFNGTISECDSSAIRQFFRSISLNETTDKFSTGKEDYLNQVNDAIKAIDKGYFEKVVLARRYFTEKEIDPLTLFMRLTKEYEGAFVYCYLLSDGRCMMGATPETLIEKKGDQLTIEALGGTGQANGFNAKEFLEHQHIITDISLKLKEMAYEYHQSDIHIKQAGNVSHLSTIFDVSSRSIAENTALLEALHPTSAVCGLPFLAAFEFICNEEPFDRNYYSGYLGYKKDDDFSLYVNLRCAELMSNGAVLFAGAGINKDSVPEKEWNETGQKLDTLLRCIAS